jgi:hypothetical protein
VSRILFLFLDGVGLASPEAESNPLNQTRLPTLEGLLGGNRLVQSTAPYSGEFATLMSLDANLGIPGLPQSATGQASILTGRNVPKEIGQHYGPKPNQAVSEIVRADNVFIQVKETGGKAALLNAYPPRYFEAIESGHRLYSTIPLAVTAADIDLMTAEDLQAGRALSVDFTGEGWAAQPDFPPTPIYSLEHAGCLLAELSQSYDLAWFDYWLTDYAGHRASMEEASQLLQAFDEVLAHIIRCWESRKDLIVVSSDHGNIEDLSKKGHTRNPVPALLIGPQELRDQFAQNLTDLTDLLPAILRIIYPEEG